MSSIIFRISYKYIAHIFSISEMVIDINILKMRERRKKKILI